MPDSDFRFRPPDRRELWSKLALTMSQAAALTGVSERQIQHWMDQGYIAPSSQGTRKINGEGLDKILLIRQARSAGIPLRRAVSMAQEYLKGKVSDGLEAEMASIALTDLQQQLRTLRTGIDSVEDLLAGLESRDGSSNSRQIPRG
jgi:DNA-binding transcriptional MerR regulator